MANFLGKKCRLMKKTINLFPIEVPSRNLTISRVWEKGEDYSRKTEEEEAGP